MKKRLLSFMLAVVICLSLVPTVTIQASAASSDQSMQTKIDELFGHFSKNAYWTTNQKACCSSVSDVCKNTEIFKTTWFKKEFGCVSASLLPGIGVTQTAWSCKGFTNFAMWYLYKQNSTDVVTAKNIGAYAFTKENITAHVKPGDALYLHITADGHSVVFYDADSTGITVLDCNFDRRCGVQKHKILYEKYQNTKFDIYRCCDHTYKTVQSNDGSYYAMCKDCGEPYSFAALDTSTKGIYTAKTTVSGCSAPYQDSGYFCYKKGTKITILGSIKNAYGNIWYKTSSGDWIYSKNLTKTSSLKSTLSVSGETYPSGTLTKGKSFVLSGTISSNYKIKNIKAYVLSDSTGKTALPVYNKAWSKTSYNIRRDGLNQAIAFGKLPAGNYTYVVQATDTSGLTVTLIKSPFVVK